MLLFTIACLSFFGLCACSSTGGSLCTVSARENWERSEGGVTSSGIESVRADAALQRIASNLPGVPLRVKILTTNNPVAYSFPDGSIYIGRALTDRLTDDELAAAIAHELGHMLHDGALQTPAGLRGSATREVGTDKNDIEQSADILGRRVLITHGIPPSALSSALLKVADASRGTPFYDPLIQRVAYLKELDAQRP